MADGELDLAVMTFPHIEGAERAYADVLDAAGQAPWVREIAFVEHHGHDRIVVRGAFAGHYVDIEDEGDLMGRKTAEGALTGAVVGTLVAGPLGLATGLVGGGAIGGLAQADAGITKLHGAFFDEVRADVPEGSSAVMLLAAPEHVDAMVAALAKKEGRLVRHHLTAEQARALEAAVADSPEAASPGSA